MGTPHFQWMKNMSRLQFLHFFTAKTGGCHSPKTCQPWTQSSRIWSCGNISCSLEFPGKSLFWLVEILLGWIWVSSQDMKHDFLNLFDTFCWDFLGLVNHHAVFVATNPHGKWWTLEDDFFRWIRPLTLGSLLNSGWLSQPPEIEDIQLESSSLQGWHEPTYLTALTAVKS